MTMADLLSAIPVLVLVIGGCLVLLLDLVVRVGSRTVSWLGALVGMGCAVAVAVVGTGASGFNGALARDGSAMAFSIVIGLTTAAALGLSSRYLSRESLPAAEFTALVLFSAGGAALMAQGTDLLVIFLGLELLSLPLYALTGLLPRGAHADEGALKYFLLGAATSAVFVYGVALLYASAGRIDLAGLTALGGNTLSFAGLGLILAGLGFKAALVPFHAWAPDAYDAAPTPATAFMAVVAKVGAFAALLRIVAATSASGPASVDWQVSLAALATATLALASFAALAQRKVKRLLAYSSIAQAGYVTIGLASGALAGPSVLFYLAVYATLTIGSFGVIAMLDNDDPTFDDLAGLWRRRPLLVLALGAVLLGLTGLPPTGGFLAKLYVFEAAARAQLLWLVIVGVLASVVSAAYYLRILLACFQAGDGRSATMRAPIVGTLVVMLSALASLALGIVPGPVLELAQRVKF